MLTWNPNRDIIENRPIKETYGVKDIGHVLSRTKMALYYVDWLIGIDTFIHHFDYPRFSNCCYFTLMLVIFFYDPAYLLSFLVIILFVVIFAYSPYCSEFV